MYIVLKFNGLNEVNGIIVSSSMHFMSSFSSIQLHCGLQLNVVYTTHTNCTFLHFH